MARLSETFLHRDRAKQASAWLPLRGGVEMRVRYYYSEVFQTALAEAAGDADKAKRVFAEHLVLDWKNLEGDDGEPMECSLDNKVMVLENYDEIFQRVVTFAQNAENFIALQEVTDEVGNS